MKKLLIGLISAIIILTGCSKNEGNEGDDLPALPDPSDVCSAMDDIVFMTYCYENFDANKDGKVSVQEAESVRYISISSNIYSLKGIERFPNIETLEGTINTSADYGSVLRYNKRLKRLNIYGVRLATLDLSQHQELENVSLSMDLGTLSLPAKVQKLSSSHIYEISILKCYGPPPYLDVGGLEFKTIGIVYVPVDYIADYKIAHLWSYYNIQPL